MQRKNIKLLIKFPLIHKAIKASRKIVLPGFEGLSLYVVTKFFFKGIKDGALNMRASSLSFSFFFSTLPYHHLFIYPHSLHPN